MHQGHSAIVRAFVCVGCLAGATTPAAFGVVQYTVAPLLATPGEAYAINQVGQVAGYMRPSGGAARGYVWSSGSLTTLSWLAGDAFAEGINDRGQVVGIAYASSGYSDPRAAS